MTSGSQMLRKDYIIILHPWILNAKRVVSEDPT